MQYPRFSSNVVMTGRKKASSWLKQFLGSFLGFFTYDADKIQIRSERAHAIDRIANSGFETWNSNTDPATWFEAGTGSVSINEESAAANVDARIARRASRASRQQKRRCTISWSQP